MEALFDGLRAYLRSAPRPEERRPTSDDEKAILVEGSLIKATMKVGTMAWYTPRCGSKEVNDGT